MAFQSIRVRFFRSLVTTMSLILAVAFLTYTRTGNDIASGLLMAPDNGYVHALTKAGFDAEPGHQTIASSPKQRWIVFLSLLVCVVGIINAQLMSVTERFREIGTLKCLGALDRFIVRIFVIEAAMQGVAGGIAGGILGMIIAIFTSVLRFGPSSFQYIPWLDVLSTTAISILTGACLSLLGVLYPALVAARMQPVEAMRVEQ